MILPLVSYSDRYLNKIALYYFSKSLSTSGIPSMYILKQESPNLPTLSYPWRASLLFAKEAAIINEIPNLGAL
jgi:hypothetical protein